jgi:hypothetical protein
MEKNQSFCASITGHCAIFHGSFAVGSTLRWCLYQSTTCTSDSDNAETSAYSQIKARTSFHWLSVRSGPITICCKISSMRLFVNGFVAHGDVLSPLSMVNSWSVTTLAACMGGSFSCGV